MSDTPDQDVVEPHKPDDYDAGDPKSVNTARKKEARKKHERQEVVRGIMSVKEGRAFIYGYLAICGTFRSPFADNQYQTAFNCGLQHIGHVLLEDIMQSSPDQYWAMIKEAQTND